MLTPVYNKKIVALQVVVAVLFSIALYFFLHSVQEEKRVTRELVTIYQKREQLQNIQHSVERFNAALQENSGLKKLSSEPTWEQVDFKWNSLSFAELIGRIDNLSHQQKIFVMESMEAGIETVEQDAGLASTNSQRNSQAVEVEKRFYHLRGYFLCPCQ